MEARKLASLDVNVIGMGTSETFDVKSEADVTVRRDIMDQCMEAKVTFVDTSPMYGSAEKVLGEAILGRREKFQLATKVWCAGKKTGVQQIGRSFSLLNTTFIEVLQIHNLVDWQTHLPHLEKLKNEGCIGLIGLTYGWADRLPEMVQIMKTKRVDTIQISYNVQDRVVENEVLPLAEELGIGVIVMRPFGKGALISGLKEKPNLGPLKEFGITTWGQALLSWLIADSRISVVIPASRRPDRIIENAWAGSGQLLPEELRLYISKETERCL